MSTSNGHVKDLWSVYTPTWGPVTVENGGFPRSEVDLEQVANMVDNVYTMRREWFNRLMDPRRNVDKECGFPEGDPSPEDYKRLYDRNSTAARVVEVLPKETWQVQPTVYEEEESDEPTEFEAAWDNLGASLRNTLGKRPKRGGDDKTSWYADEEGSPVWEYLLRADVISGIGRYGVVFLGFDDVSRDKGEATLAAEVKSSPGRRLLFMRVFPEHQCPVATWDNDPGSPRFGQPLTYNITFNDPLSDHGGLSSPETVTRQVHWTRCLHVADTNHQADASEVFAVPRLRPVLNNVLSAQKPYYASAEGYWQSCFTGLALSTHPELGGQVKVNERKLKDTMENWQNGLQRVMYLMGMSATTIAPQVVDPTPFIAVQVEAICIKLNMPVRIFKGSERGELASSQDDASWNDELKQRQRNYVTPRIIIPLVDRLIWAGVLPEPAEGYHVFWPDLTSQSDMEKADVAAKRTTALAAYVGGGVEALVPPHDYLTRVIGFTEEEADAILENAESHQEVIDERAEEEQQAEIDKQKQIIDEGVAPDPTKQPAKPAAAKAFPPKPSANVEGDYLDPTLNANPKGCNQYTKGQCGTGAAAEKFVPWFKGTADITEPFKSNLDIPFIGVVSPKMQTYLLHQAGALAEPQLIKYAAKTEGLLMIPLGNKRRLGLMAYEHPQDESDVRHTERLIKESGGGNWRAKAFENYTVFKDAKGNWSAAYGDKDKVKFLVEKFSDPEKLGKLTDADHRKLGEWFGYTEEAIEDWVKKNKTRKKKPTVNVDVNFDPRQPRDKEGKWSSGSGTGSGEVKRVSAVTTRIKSEATTTGSHEYAPDVLRDATGDGVTDAARVGVPAMTVPPPPSVGRLPNLTARERAVETAFVAAYENDPDGMARKFREFSRGITKPGEPVTFGTDDAKVLTDAWGHPELSLGQRAENRATLNLSLHQTANAVAKRAFVQELDSLKPGDEVMVTVGGCGAGKGYALKNVPEALAMKAKAKVVWDSAGDQNATENPWIQREAEARGLKVNYVFVHADPYKNWADPERGVVKRAGDPNDGRMVDAKVFADSYAIGARNHQAFYERNKDNPAASFVFLENKGKPKLLPGIPEEALRLDHKELAAFAVDAVMKSDAPPHVKRGATMGARIWGDA